MPDPMQACRWRCHSRACPGHAEGLAAIACMHPPCMQVMAGPACGPCRAARAHGWRVGPGVGRHCRRCAVALWHPEGVRQQFMRTWCAGPCIVLPATSRATQGLPCTHTHTHMSAVLRVVMAMVVAAPHLHLPVDEHGGVLWLCHKHPEMRCVAPYAPNCACRRRVSARCRAPCPWRTEHGLQRRCGTPSRQPPASCTNDAQMPAPACLALYTTSSCCTARPAVSLPRAKCPLVLANGFGHACRSAMRGC